MTNSMQTEEDKDRFLYGFPGEFETLASQEQLQKIEAVETALGFRLFRWQKYKILGIPERQMGKTSAWAISRLMGDQPIDVSAATLNHLPRVVRMEYKELEKIAKKLDAAGVPHAQLCRTIREYKDAYGAWQKESRKGIPESPEYPRGGYIYHAMTYEEAEE